jgi:hypothetical protein
MKLEALEAYKPNLSQPNTDYLIKTYLGEWGSQSTYPKVNYHNAGELCRALEVAFSSVRYKKNGEDDCKYIYDFSPRVDAHLNLFVRYMMSRLQGKMQVLDRPEIRSSIAYMYGVLHSRSSGS